MVPVRLTPKAVAVIVTGVVAGTDDVVTGNTPLDWPPLTTISDGTEATAGLLLVNETTAPSVTELNLMVPVDEPPPTTDDGLNVTDDSVGGEEGGGGLLPPLANATGATPMTIPAVRSVTTNSECKRRMGTDLLAEFYGRRPSPRELGKGKLFAFMG
jgi:hypothetical protein